MERSDLAGRAKSLVPRRARAALRSAHQGLIFSRALKRFLKDPAAHARAGNAVLRDLVYGWGNEGWSAHDEYLAATITLALAAPGPVLECGSGLSTVLVGAVASRRGVPYFALENHDGWAAKVRDRLKRSDVKSVIVDSAPLRDYGPYSWYDPKLASMPSDFALVICDGPPGATKGGRSGLLPVMRTRLRPGCVILLDDAAREAERRLAEAWKRELHASLELRGADKPFAELRLPA